MSNHYSPSHEWDPEQTVDDLTRDDDDDLPVEDESIGEYFRPTFEPPKSRDSTSSFFSEGRPSQVFGPRGLSQERHSSKDRMFEDRPFAIRLGESKDLEPRRLSSPLVPIPPVRSATRSTQSFHALEDLRVRPSSLNSLDPMFVEREKVWRRSTGDVIEAVRRKQDDAYGHRSSPIGTPVTSTRRFTNHSSRSSSPAVTREMDLQAAADTYLQGLSLDPKDDSPTGVDTTWHFPDGPPSPQLPRSSRLTTSPRLSSASKLELSKGSFDAPRTSDSPAFSSRVRLSTHSSHSSRAHSPLTTPRTLATAAPAATTFTRSPLTQKRSMAATRTWDDEPSPPGDGFSADSRYDLPPRLVTPPRESLSEQLQLALQHHQHHYALNVITGASLMATGHERQCFLDEACPICLRTEVQLDELMVILRCKLLACNHVAHANCFKEAFHSISQHPFTFFKVNPSCVPPDQTRFVRGPRSGCIISLGLFHILSEVQFGHFKVENLGSTYDPKAEQDCLNIAPLAETSTGTRPLFSLRRGRLVVECHSPATAERWRFQANYDLTGGLGANSCVDLVFVDSESKVSVQLSIIFNTGNTWAIERLTIELPPPPMSKPRIASSPQMLQQRGGPLPALSPLHRLSSNPSQQQSLPSSQNAQAVKNASAQSRLLQIQDNAKQQQQPPIPKHFKFPSTPGSQSSISPHSNVATAESSPVLSPESMSGANGPAMAFDKKPKLWDLPPNFASFEDHIPSLATTQLGSRFLQRKVEEGNPEFLALLFEQLLDFLPALIVDLFGNYLCQSMVCHATDEQRYRLLVKIKPHLVPVACARQGTRMVQKLVELSTKARDRRLILEALTGAWPASMDDESPSAASCNIVPTSGKSDSNGTSVPASASNTAQSALGSGSPSQAMRSLSLASTNPVSSQSTSTSSIVLSDGVSSPAPVAGSTTSITSVNNSSLDTSPSSSSVTTDSTNTTSTTTTSNTNASTAAANSTGEEPDEPIPNWQVTDKTALLTLMKGSSGAHVIHAILDHWSVALCRPIILFAFEMSSELGVHQHGLCVLKKCLTVCTPEDLAMFVSRIQPQIFTFINDPYGNYLIQHLLERCDAPETDPEAIRVCSAINWDLHRSLQGHYPWLSRQKFSSNVVEKCLRTPDLKLRSSIIDELTKENTISQLLQCSFGNYVMQHVLEVASPAQAAQVITRIQPDLRLLRKNIRKKWERLLLRYDADAMPINERLSPTSSETSLHTPTVTVPSMTPSPSSSTASSLSAEFNSQLLAHNRSLANEFRAFQAMQDSAHAAAGDYNEHKTGLVSRKPRKPMAAGTVPRTGKDFVPESSQPSAGSDQSRFRQSYQQYAEPSYVGYGYPQPSYVPSYVPRSFPSTGYVQQSYREQPRFTAGSFRNTLTPQQMQMMPDMQNHS